MSQKLKQICFIAFIALMPMRARTDANPPANPIKELAKAAQVDMQTALARITVYWAKGGDTDCWSRRFKSATGVRLKPGHCAVDPRKIPYFAKVQINGVGTFVAVDTGTDVRLRSAARRAGRSKKERQALVVDLFYTTRTEALDAAEELPKFALVSWKE